MREDKEKQQDDINRRIQRKIRAFMTNQETMNTRKPQVNQTQSYIKTQLLNKGLLHSNA